MTQSKRARATGTSGRGVGALIPVICALTVALTAANAWAQPVLVQTLDLLGGECMRSWGTIRVTVQNNGGRPLNGTLNAVGSRNGLHELSQSLDVPAHETVEVLVQTPPHWCELRFCYEVEAGERRCSSNGATWARNRGDHHAELFIVQDSHELRPAFAVTSSSDVNDRSVRVAVASVITQQNHGDSDRIAELPELAAAYSHFRMIVAEEGLLRHMNDAQRRALAGWVRTGGELAIVASDGSQFVRSTLVSELVPEISAEAGPSKVVFSTGLTELYQINAESLEQGRGAAQLLRFSAPGLAETTYGARAAIGLGSVHFIVATPRADLSGSSDASQAARRALDLLITGDHSVTGNLWRRAPLDFAARGQLDGAYAGIHATTEHNAARTFGLDPNQTDRLPLWIYVLIVTLCTAALFIFQHRWSKGGRGVLRLFAPTVAVTIAGSLLVFGMAYAARGVGDRYRSMAWIEMASGETEGGMWRRVALALDGPGAHQLTVDPNLAIVAPNATGRIDRDATELTINGGRWQTILAAEQGIVDLEGAVHIEWNDDGTPNAVRNTLPVAIDDAVLMFDDNRYVVGRLAQGTTRLVSTMALSQTAQLPRFLPEQVVRNDTFSARQLAAVVGTVDLGCPDRGDFRGDGCNTSLIVWGTP